MRRFPAPVTTALTLLVLLLLTLSIPHAGLAQPPSPIPREPAPGQTVTTLTFAWDPVPEATEYEIRVRAMQAGLPLEPPVWQATTYFATVTPRDPSNFPQGDLSWQVRSVDAEGQPSAWGQSQFTYQIDVPALIAPVDGATLTAEQPTRFEWTAAAGAQSYAIDVASDAGFDNMVWAATTSDTSIIPPFPIGTGELYWRVRGLAPGGNSGRNGAARHFTRSVGRPQNLVGPQGSTPTFLWDGVAGAAPYNIQVSATPDFSDAPLWEADTVNTSITPVTASFGTQTRYWRVRARDAGGFTSAWTDGGSFTLTSPGGVETLELESPAPDAVLQADPAFRWQLIEGAARYVLEVSASVSFDPLYEQIETNYNAYTPFASLIQTNEHRRETYENGAYYWRVRAIIPSGTDIVSEERRFTKAATINLVEPLNGSAMTSDPTFRWESSAGAHHYALIVGTNPEFEPVWDTVRLGNTSYIPYRVAAGQQATYANGTYFWKIQALGSDDTKLAISDAASFVKNAPLNLVAPADGATLSRTPTFVWSPVAGAFRYRLTVNTGPDFLTFYNNGTSRAWRMNSRQRLQNPPFGWLRAGSARVEFQSPKGDFARVGAVSTAGQRNVPLSSYDQITTDATQYTPYAGELAKATYGDGDYRWVVEALDSLGQVVARSQPRQLTIGEMTATPPATATWTATPSPSATRTRTPTPTWAASPTSTPSRTPTPSPSPTVTSPPTATFTPTTVPTATASATASPGPSASPTRGPTRTPLPTRTPGPSPTAGFIPPSPTAPPGGRTDTDEPNDYWTLAAPLQPGDHQSYISHERDLDWFKIWVDEPRSELRITLVHPPADYDLALLSDPAAIAGPLEGIRPLIDVGDIDASGQLVAPEQIGDIGALQDARPVRDISARRGLKSESVATNVLYQPGWYYLLVKGYNGAHSDGTGAAPANSSGESAASVDRVAVDTSRSSEGSPAGAARLDSGVPRPYTLHVKIDPPEASRYCTVQLPHPPGVIVARWAASETPQTLILVNKRRMDAYYGSSSVLGEQLLQTLAEHPRVNGIIEPVENNPEVAAAYDAWDDDACNPEAANRVTEAIKQHIDAIRAMYPTIQQVLIIGNDDMIPFHRVPDEVNIANETGYLAQVDANPDSPFYSALEQGYILTDDFYVDDEPLAWRGRRLFVPDHPIGRLVETPNEITGAIQTFQAMDGNLSLETGLVLGYDFSAGSSSQIADILRGAGINVDSMIATRWTGSDMRDSLLNTHHDANVVNARFSHNEAMAPDQSGGPLTAEAIAEVGGELSRSLFLSAGSHAGLNVPDRWATAADRLDFSQALSGRGVASVANTGYGYGVAQADDFSELLMKYFAQEITRTPDVTVGAALMRAKQRFFSEAGPASFGLYREKALVEATLFGIPSLHITVPDLAAPSGDPKQVEAQAIETVGDGLYKRTVRLEPGFEQIDTPAGSYLKADDGTVSRPGRPIQPHFTWDAQAPELGAAHGALLTGGRYTDLFGFDPVITRPLTDTTDTEPGFPFNVWTPARLHGINRLSTADGTSEQLVVIPGQFRNARTSPGSTPEGLQPQSTLSYGIERRYDSLTYDLYYSTSPDWVPPVIWRARYEKTALGAEFWVDITDPSGIARVAVTYTTGDGEWNTAELQLVEGFSWQALMPFFEPDTLDFIVQAVDGAGNVAISVDKGWLFGRRSQTLFLFPVMR